MVTPVTGITLHKAATTALELGYSMFAFNGSVYSTKHVESLKDLCNEDTSLAALFSLSDLVDYNYSPIHQG